MALTQQHKDRISAGRKRYERIRHEQKKLTSTPPMIPTAQTDNATKTPLGIPPSLTITLPSNPHRIERIITLGTIIDNMFPKTRVSKITEILHSVKRIVERGA